MHRLKFYQRTHLGFRQVCTEAKNQFLIKKKKLWAFYPVVGAKRLQGGILPHPLKWRDICMLTFEMNPITVLNISYTIFGEYCKIDQGKYARK